MMDPTKDPSLTESLRQRMVKIRRDIHQHPELAWNEHRTRDVISAQLTELGVEHTSGVAGTGVVADIPGPSGVPIIALRADTDALAIEEGTGLPFSSKARGVMHACGHDGHTSMLLGAAALLTHRSLPAPVRLIWQPAEETVDGAQAMIDAGVLKNVGMIFGGHIDPSYPTGTLVVTPGAVNASTDRFKITVEGQDAHGARPHEAVDAIVVASAVVQNLQTIVSRVLNPAEPGVVTVGRFVAGAVHNAIAGTAVLEGTLRAHSAATRATTSPTALTVSRTT